MKRRSTKRESADSGLGYDPRGVGKATSIQNKGKGEDLTGGKEKETRFLEPTKAGVELPECTNEMHV